MASASSKKTGRTSLPVDPGVHWTTIAQYLQLVVGMRPFEAGMWSVPQAVASVVACMLAPIVVRRIAPAAAMGAGLALVVIGYGMLTVLNTASGLGLVVTSSVVASFGVATVVTLGIDTIVAAAPPERAGAASAISETGTQLGASLGVAILGSIGTAVYRGAMAAASLNRVPPDAAEAARSTLGGAVAVAARLPDGLGVDLLASAREAFVHAFALTGAISAELVTVATIVTAILLRRAHVGIHVS